MFKKIRLNIYISLRSLLQHKLRTFLSVLGIAFGALSLVIVGNITAMMEKKVQLEAENFGKNLIIVRAGIIQVPGRARSFATAKTLKIQDALSIKEKLNYVTQVTPAYEKSFPIRYGETTVTASLSGVTDNFPQLRKIRLIKGRFFSKEEEENMEKVAIIGYKVYESLFNNENPIGKRVLLFRAPVEIIGVMEPMGVDLSGNDQDKLVFVPLKTMMRRFLNVDYITTIYAQTEFEDQLKRGKEEIRDLLRDNHRLKKGDKDDFFIQTISDIATIKSDAVNLVNDLGNTSSILSYAIGGLGVLAIMILSIMERRKEIGIRRACGATRKDILFQFMFEALILTIIGTAFGIVLANLITIIISFAGSLPLSISFINMAAAVFLSLIFGLFAGIYPAEKASEVDPIKVLNSSG